MAYDNNYQRGGGRNFGGQNRGSYGGQRGSQYGAPGGGQNGGKDAPKPIKAEALPENYVDEAEAVILSFGEEKCITTSKLRNLLSLASDIYNRENLRTEQTLSPESMAGINMMRIRTAYECGRDRGTEAFVRKAKLLEHLKWLSEKSDRAAAIAFFHYMEALVAYHRYYRKED